MSFPLEKVVPCHYCGGKISPLFYRLKIEEMVIDQRAVDGFVGNLIHLKSVALADVFNNFSDYANPKETVDGVILCVNCVAAVRLAEAFMKALDRRSALEAKKREGAKHGE